MQAMPTIAMSATRVLCPALPDAGGREPVERPAAVGLEPLQRHGQPAVGAQVVDVRDDGGLGGARVHLEVAAAGAVAVEGPEAAQGPEAGGQRARPAEAPRPD